MMRALITCTILFAGAILAYSDFAHVEPLKGSYWLLSLVFLMLGWATAWALGWLVDSILTTAKAAPRLGNLGCIGRKWAFGHYAAVLGRGQAIDFAVAHEAELTATCDGHRGAGGQQRQAGNEGELLKHGIDKKGKRNG